MRVRQNHRPVAKNQPAAGGGAMTEVLVRLRGPVEALLTRALRQLSRRRPSAFERLGGFRDATFRIAPTDLPVAFDLSPHPTRGRITVVRPSARHGGVALVSAPLVDLLALFDGSLDADAAFFSRSIQVEGDIGAVMALHNALESAELRLADLAALPIGANLLNRLLNELVVVARPHLSRDGI